MVKVVWLFAEFVPENAVGRAGVPCAQPGETVSVSINVVMPHDPGYQLGKLTSVHGRM